MGIPANARPARQNTCGVCGDGREQAREAAGGREPRSGRRNQHRLSTFRVPGPWPDASLYVIASQPPLSPGKVAGRAPLACPRSQGCAPPIPAPADSWRWPREGDGLVDSPLPFPAQGVANVLASPRPHLR